MIPSFDCVHDSARLGVLMLPGMGFTRASWRAYSTMKGVMIPSVSAGSSQREARVMWTPHVMVPSGAAVAERARPKSRVAATRATSTREMNDLMDPSHYRYGGARTCWNVRPDPRLCLDPEEPGRRPAQHGHALRVAQARRGEYEIHGGLRPWVGIVGAHHELARAHLGGEVAHRFGREHDVVVVQLPEILRGLLLEWPVLGAGASIGEGQAALIGAPRVRGEVAAAVRSADLEPGEAIERSLEDQVRERDGRLERVADHVRQQTVALEPARQRLRGPCSLGMDEDEDAELLGLRPERVKLRVAQLLLVDAPADGSPAQPVLLDSFLQLLGREVRVLESDRGEGHEALGVRRARLGELLVLGPDELAREIAVRPVPVGIDAERLHVDALLVHRAEAIRGVLGHVQEGRQRRARRP